MVSPRESLRLVKWFLIPGFLLLCYYLWKDALCDFKAYRKDWNGLFSCSYPFENPDLSYRKALFLSYELKEEEAKNLIRNSLVANNLHLASILLYAQVDSKSIIPTLMLVQRFFSPYQPPGNLRLSLALLSGEPELIKREAGYALSLSKNRKDTLAIIWLYMGEDTEKVLPEEAKKDYVLFLMEQGQLDKALSVWYELKEAYRKDEGLRCRVVEALLSAGRLREAMGVWKEDSKEVSPILNGSFEEEGESCGFGWQVQEYGTGYEISRDNLYAAQGNYSLHIRFDGSENPDFKGVHQILNLADNTSYELSYFVRTKGVTTNSGVYVELSCLKSHAILSLSSQYLGDTEWRQEKLVFRTPADCGGVKLTLRRRPAERLERRIEGSLWFDAFSLRELSHDGHSN
ncbi:MAG: hypothetical protein RMH93_00410 [Aquificaceae bacterium]|nr:hypothetical protein [Aquificaceae bacterium]